MSTPQVKQVKSKPDPRGQADLEEGTSSEKTPLVAKKPDHHPLWWAEEVTDKFKFAILYSARVAFWVVLCSVVPLSLHGGRALFAKYGFSVSTIVCNFLFMVGPNFGATVQKVMYAICGNLLAGVMHYLLNGFMPGGSAEQWDNYFWIGAVVCMAYMLIFMLLDINETVRFFTLSSFVGYAMNFLNPTHRDSGGFALEWSDPMVNSITLVLVAAAIAILCTLLPWAVLSLGTMQDNTKNLETQLQIQRWRLWKYYSGSAKGLDVKTLKGSLNQIQATRASAEAGASAAWYECLGLGAPGRSIKMIQYLLKTLNKVQMELSMLVPVADREDFADSHKEMIGTLNPFIRDAMVRIDDLGEACVDLTNDGNLDNREKRRLARCIGGIKEAAGKLRQEHKQYLQRVDAKTTGESTFVYAILEIARLLAHHADHELKNEDERRADSGLKNLFTVNISISEELHQMVVPSHLKWALRNSFALLLAFWIGFFGYLPGCHSMGSAAGDASCFIEEYDASIAGTVVVLLSKFVGSTFKAGLNRVSAVVLASILGKLGWVLFGWCNWEMRMITIVVIFFAVWAGMYVAYSGGEYASLGMRVAAIGAMSMLAPCANTDLNAGDYSGSYHGVIDIVISVTIMLVVDFTFAGKPASTQAEEKLCTAMESLRKEMNELFNDVTKMKTDFLKIIDGIKGDIEAAAAIAEEAKQEPRFWRRPWRPALFQAAVIAFSDVCRSVINLGQAVRGCSQAGEILASEAFAGVRTEIDADLSALVKLANYLLWHNGKHLVQDVILDTDGKEVVGLRAPQKELPGEQKLLEAINKAVGGNYPEAQDPKGDIQHDVPCRFSVVVELLRTIIKQTHKGQQNILQCKDK